MPLSRRDFLHLGGLTAVAAGSTACSAVSRHISQSELPDVLTLPATASATDPVRRLLNRAGYGPRPGDYQRASQMGLAAYLEEQLHPEAIADRAADLLVRRLTLYHMDASQLIEQEPKDALIELVGATFMRALTSKRQLYEAMVEFWSDHFNIYVHKSQQMPLLKLLDDRDVIRPYALGKFRELLRASAHSPAMLVYLDNIDNEATHPNENYARELLELHTLGVDGGYTQQDVQEVARALTGWSVRRRGLHKGEFSFDATHHDNGRKQILGHTLPAGSGQADVDQVLQILATHPATARFIATKLVRHFVADEPPTALVEQVAQTYLTSDGSIKSMLRTIFLREEFAAAPPKLKRPFTFLVSALRALDTNMAPPRSQDLGHWLQQLGQIPFHWPPPDGYPDVATAWAANLLPRWNAALALLHDQLPGANVPLEQLLQASQTTTTQQALQLFAGLVNGRSLTGEEATLYERYINSSNLNDTGAYQRLRDSIALLLAGPDFQWT